MNIQIAREIVNKAMDFLVELTGVKREDLRFESMVPIQEGIEVGLSMAETTLFYNRSHTTYILTYDDKIREFIKVERKDIE